MYKTFAFEVVLMCVICIDGDLVYALEGSNIVALVRALQSVQKLAPLSGSSNVGLGQGSAATRADSAVSSNVPDNVPEAPSLTEADIREPVRSKIQKPWGRIDSHNRDEAILLQQAEDVIAHADASNKPKSKTQGSSLPKGSVQLMDQLSAAIQSPSLKPIGSKPPTTKPSPVQTPSLSQASPVQTPSLSQKQPDKPITVEEEAEAFADALGSVKKPEQSEPQQGIGEGGSRPVVSGKMPGSRVGAKAPLTVGALSERIQNFGSSPVPSPSGDTRSTAASSSPSSPGVKDQNKSVSSKTRDDVQVLTGLERVQAQARAYAAYQGEPVDTDGSWDDDERRVLVSM